MSQPITSLIDVVRILYNKLQIAELFNKHFTPIADCLRSSPRHINYDITKLREFVLSRKDEKVTFSIPQITECSVLTIIKDFKLNKATGLDNISAKLVKIAAPII